MVEYNSIVGNSFEAPNLNNQQPRLNKINEIKYFFIADIKQRESISKRFSNYIASFDYFDKSLIVFSETSGSISVGSFATVIGKPVKVLALHFHCLEDL